MRVRLRAPVDYNSAQYKDLPTSFLRRAFTFHKSKASMKRAHPTILTTLRLLTLAAACVTASARADEYGDVSQLLRAGKLNEAMSKADVYLAAKPGDPQMRFLKGVIQRSAGKPSEAITTFTKLTQDYPELPEPYNNLAVLYASQSQFDKSRAALEMAIRTNPSYATAHENLGDVYTRLAGEAYNKALQLDGSNAAVPPKLALIRELFKPNLKSQTPVLPAAAASASVTASTAPAPPVTARAAPATPPVAAPAAPALTARAAPATPPVVAASPAITTSPSPAPAKAAVSDSAANEAEAAVRAWAKAWSSKDVAAYLGAYGKEFTPSGKQSRSAWEDERRKRIAGKSNISVKLENLSVAVNGSTAVVKFRQDYRADALVVSSRKTLDLLKSGERWLIVRESTGN